MEEISDPDRTLVLAIFPHTEEHEVLSNERPAIASCLEAFVLCKRVREGILLKPAYQFVEAIEHVGCRPRAAENLHYVAHGLIKSRDHTWVYHNLIRHGAA